MPNSQNKYTALKEIPVNPEGNYQILLHQFPVFFGMGHHSFMEIREVASGQSPRTVSEIHGLSVKRPESGAPYERSDSSPAIMAIGPTEQLAAVITNGSRFLDDPKTIQGAIAWQGKGEILKNSILPNVYDAIDKINKQNIGYPMSMGLGGGISGLDIDPNSNSVLGTVARAAGIENPGDYHGTHWSLGIGVDLLKGTKYPVLPDLEPPPSIPSEPDKGNTHDRSDIDNLPKTRIEIAELSAPSRNGSASPQESENGNSMTSRLDRWRAGRASIEAPTMRGSGR